MRRSSAFTFMELMIMVGVIGMMIPIILRFMPKPALYEWEGVTPALNAIAIFARQQAILTQRMHRISFTYNPKDRDVVALERYDEDEYGKSRYMPVVPAAFSRYVLPRGCHIAPKDEGALRVSPKGIFDAFQIEIRRDVGGDYTVLKLAIEPFLGQFKRVYNAT